MRAFVLDRYGGPEAAALRDVPVPELLAGEVRIAVRAAGLNPVDFKIREGQLKLISQFSLPIVLGSELAGVVEALGDGVTDFAIGDEVYARVEKDRMGAFAEKACVRAEHVAKKPAKLGFEEAAALPLAALTSLQALRDELGVEKGHRVFIPGGAGGVGTFAIQIAKYLGAVVTTTASPRGKELVERMGADHVIDYTKSDFESEVHDQHAAFDLLGKDTLNKCFAVVSRGRRVVSIAGIPEPRTARLDLHRGLGLAMLFWIASIPTRFRAWRRGVDYRYLFMKPSGPDLRTLATWVDEGKLEVVVDKVFPFADIKEAFAYLETGRAKGKVVVRF